MVATTVAGCSFFAAGRYFEMYLSKIYLSEFLNNRDAGQLASTQRLRPVSAKKKPPPPELNVALGYFGKSGLTLKSCKKKAPFYRARLARSPHLGQFCNIELGEGGFFFADSGPS